MKSSTTRCECSTRGRELVLITIEACRKRTCEALNKTPINQNCKPKAEKTEPKSLQRIPDDIKSEKSDENVGQQGDAAQSPSSYPPQPHKVESPKESKILKLPLLVDRYHGPGCAMEINVLEKHESTCAYKKADNECRNNMDDRVGSYECIGRFVFRTCKSSEQDGSVNGGVIVMPQRHMSESKEIDKAPKSASRTIIRSISSESTIKDADTEERKDELKVIMRESEPELVASEDQIVTKEKKENLEAAPKKNHTTYTRATQTKILGETPRSKTITNTRQPETTDKKNRGHQTTQTERRSLSLTSRESVSILSQSGKRKERKSSFLGSLLKRPSKIDAKKENKKDNTWR